MAICTKCNENKDNSAFGKDNRAKSGLQTQCRVCHATFNRNKYRANPQAAREAQKRVYAANPRRFIERQLKVNYNITLDQKLQMIDKQDNKCVICKELFSDVSKSKGPCVDHDHFTGVVRDILCGRCNSVLGYINENFDTALNLAKYIQNHKGTI